MGRFARSRIPQNDQALPLRLSLGRLERIGESDLPVAALAGEFLLRVLGVAEVGDTRRPKRMGTRSFVSKPARRRVPWRESMAFRYAGIAAGSAVVSPPSLLAFHLMSACKTDVPRLSLSKRAGIWSPSMRSLKRSSFFWQSQRLGSGSQSASGFIGTAELSTRNMSRSLAASYSISVIERVSPSGSQP
ncbi:MAG: hypothetical protein ACYTGZ_16950 [Planctomycetota bacterium]